MAISESTPLHSSDGRSAWRDLATRAFGYDIFVSFALSGERRNSRGYSSDLARRLQALDCAVFFSEEEAPPGESLNPILEQALRRSRCLVVVINRETALDPRWVRKEVAYFRDQRRDATVAVVFLDECYQDPAIVQSLSAWLPLSDRIRLEENCDQGPPVLASDGVVNRIVLLPHFRRTRRLWRMVIGSVMALLLLATTVSWRERSDAIRQADNAASAALRADQSASQARANQVRADIEAGNAKASERRAVAAASAASLAARSEALQHEAADEARDAAQRDRAQALRALARSRSSEFAARARSAESDNPELSIGLALESLHAQDAYGIRSADGEAALRSAMSRTRGRMAYCTPSLETFATDETVSLDFAPGNDLFAVGTRSNAVCLYRQQAAGTLGLVDVLQSYGHGASVDVVRFSSDGQWLVTVASGRFPRALNLSRSVLNKDVRRFEQAHYMFNRLGGADTATAISIDASGSRMALVPENARTVQVWHLPGLDPEGPPERSIEVDGTVVATGFSHDGRFLAAIIDESRAKRSDRGRQVTRAGLQLRAQVWNLDTNETWQIPRVLADVKGNIGNGLVGGDLNAVVTVGPNGKWVAPAVQLEDAHRTARQQAAEVWFVTGNGTPQRLLDFDGSYEPRADELSRITALEFSPDGRWIVVANERDVRIWPMDPSRIGNTHFSLSSPYARSGARRAAGVVYALAISPDSRKVAATYSNGLLTVWDLNPARDGQERHSFGVERPNDSYAHSEYVRFSADSRHVAAGGQDASALVCTVDDDCSSLEPRPLRAPIDEVQWRSWHADPGGKWLATVSESYRVYFWRPADLSAPFFVADLSAAGPNEPVTAREYGIVSGLPGSPVLMASSSDGEWAIAYKAEQYGFNTSLWLLDLGRHPASYRVAVDKTRCESDPQKSGTFYNARFDEYGQRLYLADKWGCMSSLPLPKATLASGTELRPEREPGWTGEFIEFTPRFFVGGPAWFEHAGSLWTRGADGRPGRQILSVDNGSLRFARNSVFAVSSRDKSAKEHSLAVSELDEHGVPGTWKPFAAFGHEIAFEISPDMKWLVAVGDEPSGKEVLAWRFGRYEAPAARWKLPFAGSAVIAFSHDSGRLAVGPQAFPSSSGTTPVQSMTALLVDLRKEEPHAEPLTVPIGQSGRGCFASGGLSCTHLGFAFSVDDRFLVSSDPSNLWRIDKFPARHLASLGNDEPRLSESGPWMATVGTRGVEVWSLAGDNPESRGIWAAAGSAYFAKGGGRLLILSNGTVFEHSLDARTLVARAEAELGRNLTQEEWRTAFPEQPYEPLFADLPAHPSHVRWLLESIRSDPHGNLPADTDKLLGQAATECVRANSVNACRVVVDTGLRTRHAASVMSAADYLVNTLQRSVSERDLRAHVEAACGRTAEAIEDFRAADDFDTDPGTRQQREAWIAQLRRGKSIPTSPPSRGGGTWIDE